MQNNYSIRQFVPLILIFFAIISVCFALQLARGSWDLHAGMYDFMGVFFIVFSAFKIIHLSAFVDAYRTYDIIAQASKTYAYAYPFIEMALGLAYLLRLAPVTTNSITALIMFISAYGVLRALLKKEQIVCACLGTVFKIPMTSVTLGEDLLMAGMALWMLIQGLII